MTVNAMRRINFMVGLGGCILSSENILTHFGMREKGAKIKEQKKNKGGKL